MSVPSLVIPVTDLVLRVASATVGAGEHPPNSNAGPYVERVQRRTGNRPPDPWCASYVTDIGMHALGDAWPVARTASVVAMCTWAERERCRFLVTGTNRGVPQPGDIYALWNVRLNRWAHVGFVVQRDERNPLRVLVRDGNTSMAGVADPALDRDGWLVAEKWRTLTSRDRLIRWVDVYARRASA